MILFLLVTFLALFSHNNAWVKEPRNNEQLTEAEQDAGEHGDIKQYEPVNRQKRSARNVDLWPDGVIPYEISKTDFSDNELGVIYASIEPFHRYTCIKVVPRTIEKHYVRIVKKEGCFSYIGFDPNQPGKVSLGNGCFVEGIVQHEIMHVLGFDHEQNRYDRDEYVKIHWDNIKENGISNFDKLTYENSEPATSETKYDYNSVLHYPQSAWAKVKDDVTIEPLEDNVEIGQRFSMTAQDAKEINALYCNGYEYWPSDIIYNDVELPYECTFEEGMCDMIQDYRKVLDYSETFPEDDDFDWFRSKGPTPTDGTGPDHDVSGKGYYIYVESSFPHKAKQIARIRTPFMNLKFNKMKQYHCLKFWYHMKSNGTMGTLRVTVRDKKGQSGTIVKLTGHQSSKWKQHISTIGSTVEEMQIVFEAEMADAEEAEFGDIALDNIEVTRGKCNLEDKKKDEKVEDTY